MYHIGQKLYCSDMERVGRLVSYENDNIYAYMSFIVRGEEEIIPVRLKSLISPLEIKDLIKYKYKKEK